MERQPSSEKGRKALKYYLYNFMKRKTIKYGAITIFLCALVSFFIFVNKPYYFENEPYQFLEVNNNFSENAT